MISAPCFLYPDTVKYKANSRITIFELPEHLKDRWINTDSAFLKDLEKYDNRTKMSQRTFIPKLQNTMFFPNMDLMSGNLDSALTGGAVGRAEGLKSKNEAKYGKKERVGNLQTQNFLGIVKD